MDKLVEDFGSVRTLQIEGGAEPRRIRRRVSPVKLSFALCVIVPTLIACLYVTLFAPKEYLSEAKFVVRAASAPVPVGATTPPEGQVKNAARAMGRVLGGVPSTAKQDAFIVADYVRSRTILDDLGGKPVLHEIFSRPELNWLSRLDPSAPMEKVKEYWVGRVIVTIDTVSGILTLRVRAFTPDDAQRLGKMVVKESEELVNQISERSRRDALKRAEAEVQAAQKRLSEAQQSLETFRNQISQLDPIASAASLGETIVILTREKMQLEGNLAIITDLDAKDSPMLRVLYAQLDTVTKQINELKKKLTSEEPLQAKTADRPISGQIAKYEDLQLERQFAGRLFAIAQTIYERAKADQDKQQLYLLTIVKPTMPNAVAYPNPILDTVLIFSALAMLWGMVTLVILSILDHVG